MLKTNELDRLIKYSETNLASHGVQVARVDGALKLSWKIARNQPSMETICTALRKIISGLKAGISIDAASNNVILILDRP